MKLVKHYAGTTYCDAAFEPFEGPGKTGSSEKLSRQSDYWRPADKPLLAGLRWSESLRRARRDYREYFSGGGDSVT